MNQEVTAFKEIKTDLEVSMDDVVSAFVSQYENNLFDRKKELTAEIRELEEKVAAVNKDVRNKVTGASYKAEKLPFGLQLQVGDPDTNWERGVVSFKLTISPKGDGSRYGNTVTVHEEKPIPAALRKTYEKLTKELGALRIDLNEVLVNLKSVTRKERQVRGRIAMRKLEDSGYASLMQDEELAKLVQLEE